MVEISTHHEGTESCADKAYCHHFSIGSANAFLQSNVQAEWKERKGLNVLSLSSLPLSFLCHSY